MHVLKSYKGRSTFLCKEPTHALKCLSTDLFAQIQFQCDYLATLAVPFTQYVYSLFDYLATLAVPFTQYVYSLFVKTLAGYANTILNRACPTQEKILWVTGSQQYIGRCYLHWWRGSNFLRTLNLLSSIKLAMNLNLLLKRDQKNKGGGGGGGSNHS